MAAATGAANRQPRASAAVRQHRQVTGVCLRNGHHTRRNVRQAGKSQPAATSFMARPMHRSA